MSDITRTPTTRTYDAFYWMGIVATLACLALILAANTEFLWRFEHTGFPLSWALGALAVILFLAAEVSPHSTPVSPDPEEQQVPSAELETVWY